MRTILVVAAEAREFAGLAKRCRKAARMAWGLEFTLAAEMDGKRFLMVADGAGPALAGKAADAARDREDFDIVISTGSCGGLAPNLRAGEVFVASQVAALEEGESYEARVPDCGRPFTTGRMASVNRVVRSVEEKRQLFELGADAVEMEAAAVAKRARAWAAPFYCIRAVADEADESLLLDYNAARDGDGRLSTQKILMAACGAPFRAAPELFRLYLRSRKASLAVGEFLADCRF